MPTTQTDHDPANGCPKCGGALWDNRTTKTNPKAPDYKCKDKACDGCIWPPKGARSVAAPAAVKQAYTAGPVIPAIDSQHPEMAHENLDTVCNAYTIAYKHAARLALEQFGKDASDSAVASMAATIFIQAAQRGRLVG